MTAIIDSLIKIEIRLRKHNSPGYSCKGCSIIFKFHSYFCCGQAKPSQAKPKKKKKKKPTKQSTKTKQNKQTIIQSNKQTNKTMSRCGDLIIIRFEFLRKITTLFFFT